jgi:hypothetical protein
VNLKCFFLLSLLTLSAGAFSQEGAPETESVDDYYYFNQRIPGDFSLGIELGTSIALGYTDKNGDLNPGNITPGLLLGLELEWYLNNSFKLGAGFNGLMAWSPNGNAVYVAPMTIVGTYELKLNPRTYALPLLGEQTLAFSFPLKLGAGVAQSSYLDSKSLDFIATGGLGAFVHPDSNFGYGLMASYWFIPQVHSGEGSVPADHTRTGHFLEITLGLTYTP